MADRLTAREALATVGDRAIGVFAGWQYLAAVTAAVVIASLSPHTWRRTVREVLWRQMLFTGVEAGPFTARVAALVGLAIVVQVQLWTRKFGQSQFIGPVLVTVVVRELGPLLANFIVIGRSGNAITTELGLMKFSGEVRVLDAQGLDPLIYLVVPRAVATTVSVLCLSVLFIFMSFVSGYLFSLFLGVKTGGGAGFIETIAGSISIADFFNVVGKSLLPGLLGGVICCVEGLSVGTSVTEIPQAVTRAVQRAVVTLFVISAAISTITYV